MGTLNESPKTIADVEAMAAKQGISFSADEYAEAYKLMEQRRDQVAQESAATEPERRGAAAAIETFNRFYPKFLQALHGFGDVSITLVQTTLVGPGVLFVLVLLLIVEQQRVYHGVSLFETYGVLAGFSATVLVILNLSLELLISYVEHREKWLEPPRYEFSLRLTGQRAAYMLGFNTGWVARPKSPAIRFKVVLRLVTVSILTLALAGSMKAVIERTGGNWFEAILVVITKSTLLELTTWLGGLLFAFAAVLSAQALSQYAARKAIEIGAALATSPDDQRLAGALEAAGMTGAAYMLARLKDHQRARRSMAAAAEIPFREMIEPVSLVPETPGTPETDMPQNARVSTVSIVPETSETPETRITAGAKKAAEWRLANNCEGMTVREAAAAAGCSASTMQRAIDAIKKGLVG